MGVCSVNLLSLDVREAVGIIIGCDPEVGICLDSAYAFDFKDTPSNPSDF